MNTNRIGMIGGGQLSLMLAEAALGMGLSVVIFAENSDCPAARVFLREQGITFIYGSLQNEESLQNFFSQVDSVVFENEFVDCAQLAQSSLAFKTSFFPSLEVLAQFQDKLHQKQILQRLEIPSAPFVVLQESRELEPQLREIFDQFGGSCVLKWARMGYDGRGVLALEAGTEGGLQRAQSFWSAAQKWKSPVYAEKKIRFKRELAVVAVHSIQGEWAPYPLVISEQVHGICERVLGPAVSLGVPAELERLAFEYAKRVAVTTGLVGTFALEFFETEDGNLWVNEIAPRVHNSGHYTQDACTTSQFENHWRAILGKPLGATGSSPGFAMLNILGSDAQLQGIEGIGFGEAALALSDFPSLGSRSHLHWYFKKESRPRRKLGHVNAVAGEGGVDQVESLMAALMDWRERWLSRREIEKK